MAILIGGLVAGILDITSAILITLYYHGSVTRMLQTIASGAIGKHAAESGGTATAALGLGFHFLIAFIWTTLFYLASRRVRFLTAHPIVAGVLYGVVVYLVMYLGVQPLAGLHPKFGPLTTSRAVLVHIFCVGLPISLSNHFSTRARR
jgi:hypothetical protein